MEFKNFLLLGIVSAIASIAAAFAYTMGYYSIIVDFSEAMSLVKIISYAFVAGLSFAIFHALIRKFISNAGVGEFIFGTLISMISLILVFVVLDMNEPNFKSEDANLFIFYYKGFLMPLIFIPALTYFALKPLFIKS